MLRLRYKTHRYFWYFTYKYSTCMLSNVMEGRGRMKIIWSHDTRPIPTYTCAEAEFLNVIGTKVWRVFLLAIHSHLCSRILPSPQSGLKLVCNVNIVDGYLNKSENSQDYTQKPQRNCTMYIHEFGFWIEKSLAQSHVQHFARSRALRFFKRQYGA